MMRVGVKIMKKKSIRHLSVSAFETELLLVMKLRSNVVMMRVGVEIMKKESIRQLSVSASETELLLVMKLRSNVVMMRASVVKIMHRLGKLTIIGNGLHTLFDQKSNFLLSFP